MSAASTLFLPSCCHIALDISYPSSVPTTAVILETSTFPGDPKQMFLACNAFTTSKPMRGNIFLIHAGLYEPLIPPSPWETVPLWHHRCCHRTWPSSSMTLSLGCRLWHLKGLPTQDVWNRDIRSRPAGLNSSRSFYFGRGWVCENHFQDSGITTSSWIFSSTWATST